MKLGIKLVMIAALPAIFVGLVLGLYSASSQTRSLRVAFERRGETLARTLSEQFGSSISSGGDIEQILATTLDPLWEEEGLLSVEVLSLNGKLLAAKTYQTQKGIKPFVCKRPILAPALPGETIRDAIGIISVSIDARPVQEEQDAVYTASLSISLSVGLGASLLAALLSRLITGPLRSLSAASRQLSQGRYDIQVSSEGNDELALLGGSFNQMARDILARDTSLRSSRDAIQRQADELSVLTKSLQTSLKEREILEATKEALSDMIIHDLKSPLSAVTSAAQLLLDSVSSEDKPFVEGMISRTSSLLGMIQDLLTIRRMEEAVLPLLPASVDLLELSRQASRTLEPVAREIGARVEVIGESTEIKADKQLLSRVMENLLSNALKYHQSTEPIRVEVLQQPDGATLRVTDKGRGIPVEFQRSIFERFHQVIAPGATARQGSGLGLTLCRMVAEAHKGKIWVESREGDGATFQLWLPREAT